MHTTVVVSDIRDMLKQRIKNEESAGTAISPPPPPATTPSPRPKPSPRPSAPPSLRAAAEPALSSSSPALPRMAGNVSSNGGVGSDGRFARKLVRPVEEGKRHEHRDRQNSPSREEGVEKSSAKRKSGEGGAGLEGSGKEGGQGGGDGGVGSVDTKRHKPSSFS